MWLQATTPLVLTLTPAMTARADIASRIGQSPFSADRDAALAGIRTVPYTLKKGETVAQAHGLTVPQLKKLNGLRTFARGFDHLQAGDELDVPAVPLTGGERDNNRQNTRHDARGPFAADRENEDAQAQQMAGMASQAGSFLASHPDGQAAAGMVTVTSGRLTCSGRTSSSTMTSPATTPAPASAANTGATSLSFPPTPMSA
ncbi:peptigoglycan-binding protein LysM [Salmonella enterica subsp. enterica serovar Enteritidis]|uniref:LysM peptidoglycan-binding domain-containing protein n=1 Tax=Salmonella enterica TaxID=28901 RepID=UPI00083E6C77|nr:LysM peptidoglycan-binding domain-containing protein [Salmonella enterica]ODI02456.1 peptigoglycan-binding protein LysM [Salmonella enterica subsp. enterica serovar Enteritidis]